MGMQKATEHSPELQVGKQRLRLGIVLRLELQALGVETSQVRHHARLRNHTRKHN